MDFVVHPLKGVNDIEFGMTPEQVRPKLGDDFEIVTHRGRNEESRSDFYADLGLFCDYDEFGHLEAIEFVLSGRPFLGSISMLTLTVSTATELLARLDPQMVVEPDGAVSVPLSLAIWSSESSDEDKDVRVETFLVGRPGYYDFLS